MNKKILLSITGALIVVVAAAAGYMFFVMSPNIKEQFLPVQPNNTVPAGTVSAISASSISFVKQDGSTATFGITSSTTVLLGQNGQSGAPVTWDAIQNGMVVLITPSESDVKVAKTIIIVPPSPVQ